MKCSFWFGEISQSSWLCGWERFYLAFNLVESGLLTVLPLSLVWKKESKAKILILTWKLQSKTINKADFQVRFFSILGPQAIRYWGNAPWLLNTSFPLVFFPSFQVAQISVQFKIPAQLLSGGCFDPEWCFHFDGWCQKDLTFFSPNICSPPKRYHHQWNHFRFSPLLIMKA